MEPASPARLYASLAGALLVVIGILGFFYDASFGGFGEVESALGVLSVNGWLNLLHIGCGALGLLLAGVASRRYALAMGILYTLLAIWGPSPGPDLAIGLLGLAAAAGTPKPGRRLESRAKAAGQRA
jgi:Domain of unknown function (DUF4383)